MHKAMTAAMTAVAGLLAAGSVASAQTVEIQTYTGPAYTGPPATYEYSAGPGPGVVYGPRVYGYTQNVEPEYVERVRPRRAGRCGTYRYWDGDRCVDARYER
jgi:hypothetical protein